MKRTGIEPVTSGLQRRRDTRLRIHSAPTLAVERTSVELRGAALKVGIHPDDVDHLHALVEGVKGDGDGGCDARLRNQGLGSQYLSGGTPSPSNRPHSPERLARASATTSTLQA